MSGEKNTEEMVDNGIIIRILSNFYYVKDKKEEKVWECFARNRLLKEGKLLYVGDEVLFEKSSSNQGVIVDLVERNNKISKPSIANIDQVVVVFSTKNPDFDIYNLDRYLPFARFELPKEEILICINKTDLKKIDITGVYKDTGFEVIYVSALSEEGLEELRKKITGKTSVLAGPSGVGKSSLIRALAPNIKIKIGELSSINAGKHTTRVVELIEIKDSVGTGLVADTPGFTQFSFEGLNQLKLLDTFKDLKSVKCSFSNCLHKGDEGCEIEKSLKLGIISESRYQTYLKILIESEKEIIYGTKQESKVKFVGDVKSRGLKIPKIEQEKKAKSRKQQKQELVKLQEEEEF